MAELTPEVMNALVKLMKGEITYTDTADEQLFDLAAASYRGRETLYEITLVLRDRGYTLAQIGERLGISESGMSRIVSARPRRPGRRPAARDDVDDDV